MGHEPPDAAQVRAKYAAAADGYDARQRVPVRRRRYELVEAPLRKIAEKGAVLDLGTGTGRLLRKVGGRGVGIDPSIEMLRRAGGLPVACADAHALPFRDDSFDAVVAAQGVFRYLDTDRAMAECARVLRAGGRLGLHQFAERTWSPRTLFRPRTAAQTASGLHLSNLRELTQPAEGAGLIVEESFFWRATRLYPYVIPVPGWLPGHLWSHCVAVFRKSR